jgi:hypothetical protein
MPFDVCRAQQEKPDVPFTAAYRYCINELANILQALPANRE